MAISVISNKQTTQKSSTISTRKIRFISFDTRYNLKIIIQFIESDYNRAFIVYNFSVKASFKSSSKKNISAGFR